MTRTSAAAPVRADVYTRVTNRIVSDLEQGVRPWLKPWNATHAAGRITRPLRATGQPYKGINVLMLWREATASGYASPFWLTYRQATAFGAQVKRGERGALVVYADRFRNKRAIFTAAAHAQRASDYLHSLQREVDGMAAVA
jgi:antirestriction protein ArdC